MGNQQLKSKAGGSADTGTGRAVRRLTVATALLGLAAGVTLVVLLGPGPWPFWPWLGLAGAAAILSCFPYRVDRPAEPYYIDLDEILLVISLLFVGPTATFAALLTGYLVGAVVRRSPFQRVLFNLGARSAALAAAVGVAVLLAPLVQSWPWDYLLPVSAAALTYSLVNQVLVLRVVALRSGTGFLRELRESMSNELLQSWPVAVSYGLLAGVASRETPAVLILAAVPVMVLLILSRLDQRRREEHARTYGLYRAAQLIQSARSDEEVLEVLGDAVRKTLGVRGTQLRAEPPTAAELGAWLPSRNAWVVVPSPSTSSSRQQDASFLLAAASLVDVGIERAAMLDELERQSMIDPLTNAYNRRYFHKALSLALENSDGSAGCLVLIDIDDFKSINDTFGHDVGDSALKELVAAVAATFRSDDILCRLGGDEFALILPGLTTQVTLERLSSLRAHLRRVRLGAGEAVIGLRSSMGVVCFPEQGRDPGKLLRSADQALYRAKREGRDRVVYANSVALAGLAQER